MPTLSLTSEELWKKVEEDRLREELLREPYLTAFRALPEVIELRAAEDAEEVALGESGIRLFAERLARSGREAVRFDRYLRRQGYFPNVPVHHSLGA
jgi:hypothetical protein